MLETPSGLRQNAILLVSSDDPPAYSCEPDQPDGVAVAQGLSVADIQAGLAAGGSIWDAAVVFTDPSQPGGGRYTPYLHVSWREDYSPLRLNRGRIKTYSSFDTLQAALREWRYTGRIMVLNQGDPDVAGKFRIGVEPPEA